MLGILPPDNTGRTGLWKVDVTPILYTQLREKLVSDKRNATYNKVQLQMALSRYMQNNKGPWNAEQAQNLNGLDDFVDKYRSDQYKKYDAEKNKIDKGNATPSAKAKKKLEVFKKLGLLPEDDKNLPENLRTDKLSDAEKENRTAQHIEQTMDVGIAIARIAMHEPSVLVAGGLALDEVVEGSTAEIAGAMVKSYKSDAKNSSEKNVLIIGLNELMGEAERLKLQAEITELHINEKDEKFREELHGLKPKHVENEKCKLFHDNIDMTKAPVFETVPPKAAPTFLDTPFVLPSLKNGPKPPTWINEEQKK
jgi:hypothetical protein